ncbi:MAG: hypothetical protein IKL37_01450 [Alphaproteobacteria bacterium]|nr:hypothetical protein [Alphaproteobacteria bacterium]
MKRPNILFYSLLGALVSVPYGADAAIRVGNPSRNNAAAYQQLNEIRGIAPSGTVQPVTTELPIPVANDTVAEQVRSGNADAPVTVSQLEQCSLIYPNGKFEWVSPTFGLHAGAPAMCTAVVELRTRENTLDGAEIVLARANVAAGDTVLCNISQFPSFGWTDGAGTVVFPADNAPTRDDVVKQMNEEQKQNAWLKILSSTVVGALGGNAMGQNKEGQEGIFGTSKQNWIGTGIGAAGGAAIGAAGAFGGKIGGDIAMSAGMNAMSGALVGNMMSSGDSVLYIADCSNPEGTETKKCLYGTLDQATSIDGSKTVFYNIGDSNGGVFVCDGENDDTYYKCERQGRLNFNLAKPVCGTDCKYKKDNSRTTKPWTWEEIVDDNFDGITNDDDIYYLKDTCTVGQESHSNCFTDDASDATNVTTENKWIQVTGVRSISKTERVVIFGIDSILDNIKGGALGYTSKQYNAKIKEKLKDKWTAGGGLTVYTSHGDRTGQFNDFYNWGCEASDATCNTFDSFSPTYIDSETGELIDLSNRARLKDTITGASVGGALGAFSAYQGAKTEIEDRLNAERRAYKDGLQKFYCVTGNRFLTFYNEELTIPPLVMPVDTETETK